MITSKNLKHGQALLVVLLAMAVLATMMLSVVSRSTSEIGTTTREEESLRAFSAAEAGVEEALITGSQEELISGDLPPISRELTAPAPDGSSTVSTFTAEVQRYPENPQQFAYPLGLLSGQAGSVWFVTRDGDVILDCSSGECFTGTSLTLCWGTPGSSEPPAALVNVIYEGGSGYGMSSTGFDPNTSRRSSNNFSAPDSSGGCSLGGQNYTYRTNVSFPDMGVAGRLILMRVVMLYNQNVAHNFGVSAGNAFPIQGRYVSSEGAAGEVTRKINAYLLNPEMPFVFDAALYSQGDIAK